MTHDSYAQRLLAWYALQGRHDLPWQHPRSAYAVWVSEVMLQQTQVATVIGYFQRFMARFPDVAALAAAPLADVLALWSGLGYYSRARNLHATARRIVTDHHGEFPSTVAALQTLPGIGRSTAAAIVAQAYGHRAAILDGNVRRVLARQTGEPEWPGLPAAQARLWQAAEDRLPHSRLADYTQALMDLGALVCTARHPHCAACPVSASCVALQRGATERIPAARPKRPQPLRHLHWLWLQDAAGRLLLERRPPRGIWGGLLALPEAASRDALAQRFAMTATELQAYGTLSHTFTHFRLHASIWQATPPQLHGPDDLDWEALTPAAAVQAGVPAPLRRLLQAALPLSDGTAASTAADAAPASP